MDIKVNNMQPVTQVPDTAPVESGDGSFKFTLSSAITDANLQAKIDSFLFYYAEARMTLFPRQSWWNGRRLLSIIHPVRLKLENFVTLELEMGAVPCAQGL